jgi:hypothetical protein
MKWGKKVKRSENRFFFGHFKQIPERDIPIPNEQAIP